MPRFVHRAALALLLALGSSAFAQNAQVTGVVKDETGGMMPGVTITSKNKESGLIRTAVSDDAGSYRLGALPPGLYSVSTHLSGFRNEVREILLVIDQTATIPFSLHPASMSESVDVTA